MIRFNEMALRARLIIIFIILLLPVRCDLLLFLICCFSGVGQDDSKYIDVSNYSFVRYTLLLAFQQAGFANRARGEYKLLPCSLGTFVNSSSNDPNALKCLECPAGNFFRNLYI